MGTREAVLTCTHNLFRAKKKKKKKKKKINEIPYFFTTKNLYIAWASFRNGTSFCTADRTFPRSEIMIVTMYN